MPPRPYSCSLFSSPFDASKLGPMCYQYHLLPFCASPRSQSEDCLTLDVYTPSLPSSNASASLPVMFWIYGGNLLFGHTQSYANLKAFAETQQLVVVAVSYRLGYFQLFISDFLFIFQAHIFIFFLAHWNVLRSVWVFGAPLVGDQRSKKCQWKLRNSGSTDGSSVGTAKYRLIWR